MFPYGLVFSLGVLVIFSAAVAVATLVNIVVERLEARQLASAVVMSTQATSSQVTHRAA